MNTKKPGGRFRILGQEEIDWAYQKWCEGYTQREIGAALYVSTETVNKYLIRKGPKVKPPLVYTGKRGPNT